MYTIHMYYIIDTNMGLNIHIGKVSLYVQYD